MPLQPQDVRLIQTELIPPFEAFLATPDYTVNWRPAHLSRIQAVQRALHHVPLTVPDVELVLNKKALYAFMPIGGPKIYRRNTAPAILNAFAAAGNCAQPIAARFDDLTALVGIGKAVASETLHRSCPDQCALLSSRVREVLECYPWSHTMKYFASDQKITGAEYLDFCNLVGGGPAPTVLSELAAPGFPTPNINGYLGLGTDYEVADTFFRFWNECAAPGYSGEINDPPVKQLKYNVDLRLGVVNCLCP